MSYTIEWEEGEPSSEGLINCVPISGGARYATVDEAIDATADAGSRVYTVAGSFVVRDEHEDIVAEQTITEDRRSYRWERYDGEDGE